MRIIWKCTQEQLLSNPCRLTARQDKKFGQFPMIPTHDTACVADGFPVILFSKPILITGICEMLPKGSAALPKLFHFLRIVSAGDCCHPSALTIIFQRFTENGKRGEVVFVGGSSVRNGHIIHPGYKAVFY